MYDMMTLGRQASQCDNEADWPCRSSEARNALLARSGFLLLSLSYSPQWTLKGNSPTFPCNISNGRSHTSQTLFFCLRAVFRCTTSCSIAISPTFPCNIFNGRSHTSQTSFFHLRAVFRCTILCSVAIEEPEDSQPEQIGYPVVVVAAGGEYLYFSNPNSSLILFNQIQTLDLETLSPLGCKQLQHRSRGWGAWFWTQARWIAYNPVGFRAPSTTLASKWGMRSPK